MVWVLAVVCSVIIGLLSARGQEIAWIGLTLAACTIATLAVQIGTGRKEGYVSRMTASIVGAVVVLAVATGVFALIGLM